MAAGPGSGGPTLAAGLNLVDPRAGNGCWAGVGGPTFAAGPGRGRSMGPKWRLGPAWWADIGGQVVPRPEMAAEPGLVGRYW